MLVSAYLMVLLQHNESFFWTKGSCWMSTPRWCMTTRPSSGTLMLSDTRLRPCSKDARTGCW